MNNEQLEKVVGGIPSDSPLLYAEDGQPGAYFSTDGINEKELAAELPLNGHTVDRNIL